MAPSKVLLRENINTDTGKSVNNNCVTSPTNSNLSGYRSTLEQVPPLAVLKFNRMDKISRFIHFIHKFYFPILINVMI